MEPIYEVPIAHYNKLKAKHKQLVEALDKYGQHLSSCRCVKNMCGSETCCPCDCGLAEALKAAGEEV